MQIDRRALLGTLAVAAAPIPPIGTPAPAPPAPPSETIPLWPSYPPGSPAALPDTKLKRLPAGNRKEYQLQGVAMPAIHVYRPATKPNGIGLLVAPGGGYVFLSVENEGSRIADWYTGHGYTVFVLNYRLPGEGWTDRANAPLQDAQRAMRIIRARAASFHVDPAKLGVLGFSAGGHLAASLATNSGEAVYPPIDAIDAHSAKPAFVGLLYAVTTMRKLETHSGSRANLLGPDPSPELVDHRSPLNHIDQDTPPCFLAHALDDDTVSPNCSTDWLAACRAAKVPVEAHLFERGGHGFGLHLPDSNSGSLWPELFLRWANTHAG